MTEERLIKTVNYLLLIASTLIFYGVTYYVSEEHRGLSKNGIGKSENHEEPVPQKEFTPNLLMANKAAEVFYTESFYQTIEYEFLGYYFITAYCPEECGWSWSTSSGAICHYEEEWYEPTTAAIDRRFHGYNEILAIGDGEDRKLYVTEDTGPGVQGHWIDCFVETMDEVRAWDTGWRPVYRVSYETHYVSAREGRKQYAAFNDYLLHRVWSDRLAYRNDS